MSRGLIYHGVGCPLLRAWLTLTTLLLTLTPCAGTLLRLHRRHSRAATLASAAGSTATPKVSTHKELFPVQVNFEIEDFDPAGGVTMMFGRKDHKMRLDQGLNPSEGLAWGYFVDKIDENGWSELHMETSDRGSVNNGATMYAAGFAEGFLTCVRISEFYRNTYRLLLKREASAHALSNVKGLIQKQLAYARSKADLESNVLAEDPEDPYWKQIRYVLTQLWGVCDGYNFAARHFGVHTLGLEDLVLLNSGGELPQMMEAFATSVAPGQLAPPRPNFTQFLQLSSRNHKARVVAGTIDSGDEDPLDEAHWERRIASSGRCSGFVRLNADKTDLLIGHSTWDDYSKMTRIFKYYNFPLQGAMTMAAHIGMSSYPGAVSSTDDFYVLSSGLGVLETSLEVLDLNVWNRFKEFSVQPRIPAFAHSMAVNRLARSATHWAQLYSSKATVSYASQWMAVDFNRFQSGMEVQEGTLWVVEGLAGLTHAEDMSRYLRNGGFWPSFNRPYFDDMRAISGFTAAEQSHGSLYSWASNPRAGIFAAAASTTNLLIDMRRLMNHNENPSNPGHEVSARMDLTKAPLPNGGIDAKITNACLLKKLEVQAISGPSHEALPVFRWTSEDGRDLWPDWPHTGLPDVWNFGFVTMSPSGMSSVSDTGGC